MRSSIENNQNFQQIHYTHSINRINPSLLRLIDQRFTPHIKNISQKAKTIVSFQNPDMYKSYLIAPEKAINTKLIEDEWSNLQHIYASLLMGTTSQSIIIGKLSSYERSNKTARALWEFDKIFSSLHILQFIDDPEFRQVIRTALNRGEGYHQLTGKIASVNGKKFRGSSESELFIWNECSRFIANCIIYYNAMILSKIYEAQKALGNLEALDLIKRLSPIAWRHININGRYEFTSDDAEIDLDQMIAGLVFEDKQYHKQRKKKA